MTPKTQTEAETDFFEDYDREPDTSHPDFEGLECTEEDLIRARNERLAGRLKTIPWEEVKRNADALYG
jgi:hypothetical protein